MRTNERADLQMMNDEGYCKGAMAFVIEGSLGTKKDLEIRHRNERNNRTYEVKIVRIKNRRVVESQDHLSSHHCGRQKFLYGNEKLMLLCFYRRDR